MAGAYLQAQAQAPLRLSGLFSGKGSLLLAQPLQANPGQRATVSLSDLQLTGLALGATPAREPLLRLASLALDQLSVDLAGQKVNAGALKRSRPNLGLARVEDGRWNYQHDWLRQGHPGGGDASPNPGARRDGARRPDRQGSAR